MHRNECGQALRASMAGDVTPEQFAALLKIGAAEIVTTRGAGRHRHGGHAAHAHNGHRLPTTKPARRRHRGRAPVVRDVGGKPERDDAARRRLTEPAPGCRTEGMKNVVTRCQGGTVTRSPRDVGNASEVSNEVLCAAWDIVHRLDETPRGELEVQSAIQRHFDRYGRHELLRAHLMLAGILASYLVGADRVTGADRGKHLDPFELVRAVLGKLRRHFTDLDSSALPTLAAVLTAGVLGDDVLAWAEDHLRKVSGTEALGLVYAVWCLADLHDTVTRPGTTHRLLGVVFASESV